MAQPLTVPLNLEPNEASDLAVVDEPGLLEAEGCDAAYLTVLDEGRVEDSIAVLGHAGVAQVDLGTRVHRNRPLGDLGATALAVLHEGLDRAGVTGMAWPAKLARPGEALRSVGDGVRPPLVDVPSYRRRAG